MASEKEIQKLQNSYLNSAAYKNQQRLINATIDDIAKKYGFDFSRDYANRQAEVIAQAERNAYNNSLRQNKSLYDQTIREIDTGIRNASNALDHEYFQQMLGQQQAQVNSGLNAGIAADQNLRLAMNKQAQLGGLYSQAENARMNELTRFGNEAMRLREALDLVEKQREINAEKIFQELREKGYNILSQDRKYANETAGLEWGRISDQIATQRELMALAQQKYLEELQMKLQRELENARLKQQRELETAKLKQQRELEEARLALQRQQLAAQQAAAKARASSYYTPSYSTSSSSKANLSEIEKLIKQYVNNPGNYKGGIGSQVGSRNVQRVSL